jgi:uncharacterized protein
VYPCDFYVDAAHYLGNLSQASLEHICNGATWQSFVLAKAKSRAECTACRWLALCRQGCPRLVASWGSGHYLCRAYQRFFAHSEAGFMDLRQRLLQQRRAAGATQHVPLRPIGRNDPCPCGSGRKYKRCCGYREVSR